ncbi:hypothetical protein F383_33560 [Gossypium arboreum]|uniref:Uncharacterized protein n=1 Tax=Gossypium arboreum TaxID=29729 RepID=A0A0B0N2Y0_GOSAR|nr:hypothetical protein F383_33560 [Gossypium arboreum]
MYSKLFLWFILDFSNVVTLSKLSRISHIQLLYSHSS